MMEELKLKIIESGRLCFRSITTFILSLCYLTAMAQGQTSQGIRIPGDANGDSSVKGRYLYN